MRMTVGGGNASTPYGVADLQNGYNGDWGYSAIKGDGASVVSAYNAAQDKPTSPDFQQFGDPNANIHAALMAMTPQQQSNYVERQYNAIQGMNTKFGDALQSYGPMVLGAAAGVLTGGAASAAIGGLTGAIAGGAAGGVASNVVTNGLQGNNITAGGLAKSAVLGGAGAGLASEAGTLSGDLSSATGLNQGVSNALVKGASSLGMNALGNALSGSTSGVTNTGTSNSGVSNGGALTSGATQMGPNPMSTIATPGSSVGTSGGAGILGGLALGGGASYLGAGATGQGNNGSMTSTDSSLASTITGALPGVLQAGIGTAGSLAAANAETNAYGNAITTQQNTLGNINNIWGTQQKLGQGADTSLGSALGTNGQPANYSGFENMPGYAFATQQGTQAIQRQAAAMGSAYTPNTAAAVGQYVTGTAMQDYNTYISQLMGAAGLGTTANTNLQGANINAGNNISTLQGNIGKAQAGGYLGTADATGSLFGANGAGTSLINAAGKALGSSGVNSSGVPQGGGTVASNAADPFSGTPLANNQNAIDAYNQNNVGDTGIDPSTGQSWGSEAITTPTFDSSGLTDPSAGMNFGTDMSTVGGSLDYGSGAASNATSYLGF